MALLGGDAGESSGWRMCVVLVKLVLHVEENRGSNPMHLLSFLLISKTILKAAFLLCGHSIYFMRILHVKTGCIIFHECYFYLEEGREL